MNKLSDDAADIGGRFFHRNEQGITSWQDPFPSRQGQDGKYLTLKGGKTTWEPASVPVGTILAWATENIPADFLRCDGTPLKKAQYRELFAVLGMRYGGDADHFRIPDYQGFFLRARAHAAGRDPEWNARQPRPDGAGGNNVGTWQGHVFGHHAHGISWPTHHEYALNTTAGGSNGGYRGGQLAIHGVPTRTNGDGGNETRPLNISVEYIIKF